MLKSLRNLFGAAERAPRASLPEGTRAYAVGDIHGRADLFAALARAIDADDAARGTADSRVVLLGDLIDRGPDSAGVIRLARQWQARRKLHVLMGNHEEMLLDALESEEVLRHFLRYGGKETLLSYPVDPAAYTRAELGEVMAMMHAAIPGQDLDFIRGFENSLALGDYLFVHAGIDPDLPVDGQRPSDLRWIREPFLSHAASFGPIVVHGHTISQAAELRPNRIGIDTGAWRSGRLTALGLEGTARWLIEAIETDGTIVIAQRSIR
jgi:serine/threonine protein phosphatase 1